MTQRGQCHLLVTFPERRHHSVPHRTTWVKFLSRGNHARYWMGTELSQAGSDRWWKSAWAGKYEAENAGDSQLFRSYFTSLDLCSLVVSWKCRYSAILLAFLLGLLCSCRECCVYWSKLSPLGHWTYRLPVFSFPFLSVKCTLNLFTSVFSALTLLQVYHSLSPG